MISLEYNSQFILY